MNASPSSQPSAADLEAPAFEGALAIPLSRLYRRTAHDLRGHLSALSLNTALLGRAARGEPAVARELEAHFAGDEEAR